MPARESQRGSAMAVNPYGMPAGGPYGQALTRMPNGVRL